MNWLLVAVWVMLVATAGGATLLWLMFLVAQNRERPTGEPQYRDYHETEM